VAGGGLYASLARKTYNVFRIRLLSNFSYVEIKRRYLQSTRATKPYCRLASREGNDLFLYSCAISE